MLEESVSSVPSLWSILTSWFTPTFLFLNLMIATIALTSSLHRPHPPDDTHQPPPDHPHPHPHPPSVLQRLKSINFYSPRSPPPVTHFSDYGFGSVPLPGTDHDDKPNSSFFASSLLHRLKSFTLFPGENSSPDPATTTSDIVPNRPFNTPIVMERGTHLSFDDSHEEEQEEAAPQEQGFAQELEEEDSDIYGRFKNSRVGRTKSDTKPASGEMPAKLPKKMKKSASSKSAFAHFEEDDIVEKFRPFSAKEAKAKVSDEEEEEEEEECEGR